jgi:hypothetical protein
MGAREWLNQHPNVAIGGVCAVVVLAICLIVAEVMAGRHKYPADTPRSFYSDDDGKTFFVGGFDDVPPFDHDGKQAVRAYVFQCGKQQFVGYLERFVPKYHDAVLAHGITPEALRYGRELKRPGDAKWIPSGNLRIEEKIEDVPCPDGGAGIPDAVEP